MHKIVFIDYLQEVSVPLRGLVVFNYANWYPDISNKTHKFPSPYGDLLFLMEKIFNR